MKSFKTIFLFIFGCVMSVMSQGDALNAKLISKYTFNENGSDIWGYEKDDTHYAIMGTLTKTNIFSLEDPKNPKLVYEAFGTRSIWRDIKYYGDYIYVVADQGRDGLLIIDMSKAPDTITHRFYKPSIILGTEETVLQKCHNLYIDENGYAYLAGCNIGRGGVLIFNLNNDPENPDFVGAANIQYSHDAFARGDTLYTSEIYQGNLGIYDVSDKANPRLLALQQTSRTFTHNAWPSDDGKYVFTTDERAGAFVDAFDITDLNNIKLLDRFRPLERQNDGVIPHNTHYHQGYLVTSWYTDGVRIVDANKPDNLVEVAYFDTWEDPLACHNGFSGCWGAYPYTGSNIVYASDMNNGLFVIEVDYKRAAYLEGLITDINDNPINGVTVEIISSQINNRISNSAGIYKTGLAYDGIHSVRFSHPEYISLITEVDLVRGEVTPLNLKMVRKSAFEVKTKMKDFNENIIESKIKFIGDRTVNTFTTKTNETTSLNMLSGTYNIFISQWGNENKVIENFEIGDNQDNKIEKTLLYGYQDNFEMDLGWSVENMMTNRGRWVRATPREINSLGITSRPGTDSKDLGSMAFITGNGAPGAACDGLVMGETKLISPIIDLTNYHVPFVNFDIWYNKGLNPESPDELQVWIHNGKDSTILISFTDNTTEWLEVRDINLSSFIELTDSMRLIVLAQSYDSEYPITAGFDNFYIPHTISSTENILKTSKVLMYPNPASDKIWLKKLDNDIHQHSVTILNVTGNIISKHEMTDNSMTIDIQSWPAGIYFIKVGQERPKKLVKF